MAKKLFHDRVKASMCPVYEDISDDEFDPTEIQIVEKPFNYMGTMNLASYENVSHCMNKLMYGTPSEWIKESISRKGIEDEPEDIEAASQHCDIVERSQLIKVREEFKEKDPVKPVDEKLLMKWSENHLENLIELVYHETEKSVHNDIVDNKDIVTENHKPDDQMFQEESINHKCIETEAAIEYGDIGERSQHLIKVREEFKEKDPVKPLDEKLLMEWSDISDEDEGQEEMSQIIPAQLATPLKEQIGFNLKVSDNIFQYQADYKKSSSVVREASSLPPSIPYFFVEQKELLAEPWKIKTTPQKISLSRKKVVREKIEHLYCPHCTRKFWKQSKLREHIKTNHFEKMKNVDMTEKIKRYQLSKCPDCKKQLKTKTDMYVHRLTHLVPGFETMPCPLCGDSQYTYNTLNHHVRTEHKVEDKWFCPVCPDARTFTQNHSLLIHISNFHFDPAKEVPLQYPCNQCNQQFGSKVLLGRHINSHHLGPSVKQLNLKMFKCEVCGKDYERFLELKKHIKARHMHTSRLVQVKSDSKVDFACELNRLKESLLNNSWSKDPTRTAKVVAPRVTVANAVYNSVPPANPIRQC